MSDLQSPAVGMPARREKMKMEQETPNAEPQVIGGAKVDFYSVDELSNREFLRDRVIKLRGSIRSSDWHAVGPPGRIAFDPAVNPNPGEGEAHSFAVFDGISREMDDAAQRLNDGMMQAGKAMREFAEATTCKFGGAPGDCKCPA